MRHNLFKITQNVLVLMLCWGLGSCDPPVDQLHFTIPDGYRGLVFTVLTHDGFSSREGKLIKYAIPESGILQVKHLPRTDWFRTDAVTLSGKVIPTATVVGHTSSTVTFTAIRGTATGNMDIYYLGTVEELNRMRKLIEFMTDEEILNGKSQLERRTLMDYGSTVP